MSQEAVAVDVPDVRRRDAEETSPDYAPIQSEATRSQVIMLSFESVQNSTVLSRQEEHTMTY